MSPTRFRWISTGNIEWLTEPPDIRGTHAPNTNQYAYRWYNDDGGSTSATPSTAENTAATMSSDGNLHLRIGIENTGSAGTGTTTWQLQINTTTSTVWNTVPTNTPTAAAPIYYINSTGLTDSALVSVSRLTTTPTAASFSTLGKTFESATQVTDILAGFYIEHLFSLQGSSLVDAGDTYTFRVISGGPSAPAALDSYSTNVPTLTIASAGDASTALPSSATLAITADSPAITQTHTIVTSSANLAIVADSPSVTQVHSVSASSANLAITADSPTVVQNQTVVVSSANLAITADSPAVTQVHQIVTSSANLAITADSPAVTQTHQVVASSANLAITADSPTVTQFIAVTPSSASLAIAADSPTVTQVHQVTASSANLAITADSPAVTQTHNVTASSANLAITADSPTVVQNVPVTASSANLAIAADSPAVTQTHQVAASSANLAITADSPSVVQNVPVTASSASLAIAADSPAVTQTHQVTASSANLAITADNVTVTVGLTALPSSASLAITADSPAVTQVHTVVTSSASLAITADSPTVTQTHTIVTSSASLAITADSPTVTQTHQVTASSASLAITADNVTVSTEASTGGGGGFLTAKLLSITTPTSTGQQSYAHGLGEVPKISWFWGSGTASSNGSGADMHFLWGMAESTASQRSVGAYAPDNFATSDGNTAQSESHVIYTVENGSSSLQLSASLVALTSTGFTLDFDTVTTAVHTYHVAVMGGGINTKVESNPIDSQLFGSTAVLVGSTTVGFQPDVGLHVLAHDNPYSTSTGQFPRIWGSGFEWTHMLAGQATTYMGQNWVGVGSTSAPRFNANVVQRGIGCWSQDGAATVNTRHFWNRGHAREAEVANSVWALEDWTADGFTYQSGQFGIGSWTFATFLGGVNRKLVEIDTATSTGDVATTGIGFQPEMLIVWSANTTAGINALDSPEEASMTVGIALSTSEQMCAWTGGEDNVANTNMSRDQDSAAIYKRLTANGSTPTLQAEARLASFDTDGFTLTWVDADTEARKVFVMAIQGQAPPPIDVTPQDANLALTADSPLVDGLTVSPQDALLAMVADSPAVDGLTALPDDALLALTADSPLVDGLTVSPDDALLTMTADNVTVRIIGALGGTLPYLSDTSTPGSASGVQGSNYTSQIRRQS